MLGELPGEELRAEEASRAFNVRPVWQRIAIALAGPAMNMILPVFLIAAILMSGVPTLTSRVGGVVAGLARGARGVRPGDRVVAVGGAPIAWWEDLDGQARRARSRAGWRCRSSARAARGPRSRSRARRTRRASGRTRPVLARAAGTVRRHAPDSPAAQAGVKTGDRVPP